jgi:CRISPR-associated protein Csd1
MMLQALCRLADSERLIDDPDFEYKPISWVISLDRVGNLIGIADQRRNVNEGTKKKAKWEGTPVLVPRQPIRTSGDAAFFLVDKSEYVLGLDPTGERAADHLAKRVKLFRDQIAECSDATQDPSVGAIVQFIDSLTAYRERLQQDATEMQWAPNDLFGFRIGLESEFVHRRTAVREFWKRRRALTTTSSTENSFTCLVSGDHVAEVGLFPLLKRVPGGTSSGVALVSYNAGAFESFGLKNNQNAPISRAAAEKVGTALNRLLHDSFPNPLQPGSTLPSRNIRLSADTCACYWAASTVGDTTDWLNSLAAVLSADTEETVGEKYRSVWHGRAVPLHDTSAFYVLVLSGAQGRAVVRDWIETTLAETSGNLARHFQDLAIVRNARPKKGTTATPAVPLRVLLESLAAEGKGENIPAPLETGFLRAAFTGQPYPFQLLQRVLLRERAEASRRDWLDIARKDARAALLKAVLNRRRRFDPQAHSRYPEVAEHMDPSLANPGYALGMLLAVLERLQAAALGNVNASIVDRYFSAASATPRTVFTRLMRNARHHARKAADADEKLDRITAHRMEKIIDEISQRFKVNVRRYPAMGDGIPGHLDLEQQALFMLGYHQMRYWLWMTKEERSKWESDYPEAPRAFQWSKKDESLEETAAPTA